MSRPLPPLSFSALASRTLPPDFLSFTLDTSLVLGGRWWGAAKKMQRGVAVDTVEPLALDDGRLVTYAKALSPAMVRIGGTEADRVRYHLKKGPVPAGTHEYCLRREDWKRIHKFVRKADLEMVFTLSAGPDDRDPLGAWVDANARALVKHTVKKGWPVRAWELGNEVNGFPFIHGLATRVSPRQYSADFQRLGLLLAELDPLSLAVGPSSAVWPLVGEPNPLIGGLCRGPSSTYLGAVSWHYYPQQSHHGPVATRRVGKKTMLNPRNLDGVTRWTRMVSRALAGCRHPGVENWMTETAHALYGGEPGISDTYASTLWWLDELGLVAREGVDRVFRQALVGARYGLLDEKTLDPRPDFYASFLWKKLMGSVVYPSPVSGRWPGKLRVYVHGSPENPLGRTVLAINLSEKMSYSLEIPGTLTSLYRLAGRDGLCSSTLTLNGVTVDDSLVADWGHKRLVKKHGLRPHAGSVQVPPLGIVFVQTQLASV